MNSHAAPAEGAGDTVPRMTVIDHVILGTRDLDAAAHRLWEQHGLASYEGGVHPEYGTANRIVPLGGCYIEIMGIADDAVAGTNPLGRFVLSQIDAGDRWIAWCLRPEDIESTAARIGSAAIPGRRMRPEGQTVTWRLAGLEIALAEPPLPFFIAWDDPAQMPGRQPLEHRTDVKAIRRVELACDPHRLRSHAGSDLPVRVVDGPAGIIAVTLATGDGSTVTL